MLNKIKNFWSRNRRQITDTVLAIAIGASLTAIGYGVGYNQGTTDMIVDIVRKNDGEVIHF